MELIILVVGILAALPVGIWRDWLSSLSLMLGVLTTIAYLELIARQVKRLGNGSSYQAKQAAVKGVFLRYFIVMMVLVAAARIRWLSIYWVMGGLLLIPLSSIVSLYTMKAHD
jgi:hypothetical protein